MCVIVAGAFVHAEGPVNKGPVAQSSIIWGVVWFGCMPQGPFVNTIEVQPHSLALHTASYTIQPITL